MFLILYLSLALFLQHKRQQHRQALQLPPVKQHRPKQQRLQQVLPEVPYYFPLQCFLQYGTTQQLKQQAKYIKYIQNTILNIPPT